MSSETHSETHEPAARRWKPIPALERRVLGVLMEKAKTTPEQYPMTLNGMVTGCNQKSNRYPQMDIDADDLEPALENLKKLGAATEIIGGGRTAKYRHHFYEWFGVNKVESAVMTELLLRGAQTEGELRTRASRMEPIADLTTLRTILDGLRNKGLVISLTPAGRGQLITHALYEPRELEKLRAEAGRMAPADDAEEEPRRVPPVAAPNPQPASRPAQTPAVHAATPSAHNDEAADMVRQHHAMRAEITQLRSDIDDLTAELRRAVDEIRQLKDSLGG